MLPSISYISPNYAFEGTPAPLDVDEPAESVQYIEGEAIYKTYRPEKVSTKGAVSEKEYQVLEEIFTRLAYGSYFQLFKQKGEIEGLKSQVFDIHPFNFLEAVKSNEKLKELFLLSINKYFVRSQCISSFKEELKNQHQLFQNIQPHLDNFSKKMDLDPGILNQCIVANKLDKMLQHILQKNS